MIVGSFLLLLAGVVLLVAGLAAGNDTFLVGTIVAALVAAVCLYAASRRPRRTERDDRSDRDGPREEYDSRLRDRGPERDAPAGSRSRHEAPPDARAERAEPPVSEPEVGRRSSRHEHLEADARGGERDRDSEAEIADGIPGDEPSEVPMSSVEAAALMRMDAEVMVVDGRPRFHLGGCVHLVDRESEPLPAYEAVELGFTACSLCRPAQSLLREPTRR